MWQHHCEKCFACLQWCPQEAIQFGSKTSGRKRYHHPDVKLADMVRSSSKDQDQCGLVKAAEAAPTPPDVGAQPTG